MHDGGDEALRRAEEAVLRHCVARGLLAASRADTLRAEADASGVSALALVARAVPRAELEGLRRVHREALAAEPTSPPLLRGSEAPPADDAPWQDADTFIHRGGPEGRHTERVAAVVSPTDTVQDLTTLPLPDPPTVREASMIPLPTPGLDGRDTVKDVPAVGRTPEREGGPITTVLLGEGAPPLPLPAPARVDRSGSRGGSLASTRADLSASAVAAPRPDALPVLIGPFPVQAELGRDRSGVVYRAWHAELGRDVAIKVPPPGETLTAAGGFLAAARAMARLRHPNVVMVHEVGEAEGRPYLVMDLVPGRTLAAVVSSDAPLPPRQAAQLTRSLALAVAEGHNRSVLHRALRPSCVLLAAPLEPVLTDFGLVAAPDAGDAAYLAPEALRGEEPDRRADVYSLGAVLYELLTGAPPFTGPDVDAVRASAERDPPPPPSAAVDGLDPDLEAVCLWCLEKAPDDRPASAQELALELSRWLDGLPVRRLPPLRRLTRWAGRRPAAAVMVAVGALTGLIALVCGVVLLLGG